MDPYERILVIDNAVEAEAVRVALDDAGIGHALISFYDSALDGLLQLQQGWGCVMAHADNRDRVTQIVTDIRSAAEGA